MDGDAALAIFAMEAVCLKDLIASLGTSLASASCGV